MGAIPCTPHKPCSICGASTGHPSGVCVLCQPAWPNNNAQPGSIAEADALLRLHIQQTSRAIGECRNRRFTIGNGAPNMGPSLERLELMDLRVREVIHHAQRL